MTTFALAHGAFHGAWCWELLTPLLEQAGHDVVAMELPIDDPSASFDDQADVVCSAIQGHDDAVLVGHSFAGNVIPWWRRVDRCVIWCTCAPRCQSRAGA